MVSIYCDNELSVRFFCVLFCCVNFLLPTNYYARRRHIADILHTTSNTCLANAISLKQSNRNESREYLTTTKKRTNRLDGEIFVSYTYRIIGIHKRALQLISVQF